MQPPLAISTMLRSIPLSELPGMTLPSPSGLIAPC
jgi:hypothetical protein